MSQNEISIYLFSLDLFSAKYAECFYFNNNALVMHQSNKLILLVLYIYLKYTSFKHKVTKLIIKSTKVQEQ